ncbi:FtsK/SpoIIIE domain-containing protein [Xenorhabdus bovienii]|uniref:FtsK/SpoIIIE domain-containing protein n=1 Tax=Xenorhabdus bovienii TaxID=40576 RepID=UPI0023B23451|nr:FtsK/SpoIIIE domain-containing protein [Xenorhabdus bovienii]MDE9465095.1 DNA translocase FtsK [Xenorhabdus bovienii]
MRADKIVGRVGTTILKNRLAELGQGAQDTAARFRLDRLLPSQVASVVREVVNDPVLNPLVDVKIPDLLVIGEVMPEGTIIHGNAGLGRNLDTEKQVLLTANGDEPGIADTVAYVTALGAREFKSHGDAWAEAAVRVIGTAPTAEDMRLFRAALSGLFAVPDLDLPLHQAGEFCVAVASAIHLEGLPIRLAIGYSLPTIGLPRDTSFFANERTFGTAITPWKKNFEKLASDRLPLLAKLRKTGQPIDAIELKERYESNVQDIAEYARPIVQAFLDSALGERESAKELTELEWEKDGVNLIFERPKEKQQGLVASTLEFFEYDHPDALDDRWRKHLEEMKAREKRSDWQIPEDEEFFERHHHFIDENADLRKRWEKAVFGKPVECFDFLNGFITVVHRLVRGAGDVHGERFLRVRIRRRPKDWRANFNHDVGAYFSMMYRGLAGSLGEYVDWRIDGQGSNPYDPLFDYPNYFGYANKNGKLKKNISSSRAATQLKFDVFLVERGGGGEKDLCKIQLIWSARPQAIGLALREDVKRLLQKGGPACTDVSRKRVSSKGSAQTVSLLDVGTLEAIFGRDSGTLVPQPARMSSMRKDIKDRIDEEFKNNRYSIEQRDFIRSSWDIFENDYSKALEAFIEAGLHSEVILKQADSFSILLRALLEHARGDVCRSRLLARVLSVGTVRLSGEQPALIIPPWHPERLKALFVKTRRCAGLIAHMLIGENVTCGDWKIFFRDFSEELEHPFYPEIALATQDNGLTLVSETATINGYSLLEPPARGESGAMTDVLPGPAAKEIRELLERYVGLQPHEADNLSVLLYDADAAALPLATIRELEAMQIGGYLQCNIAVRHRNAVKLRGIYSELISKGDAEPDVPIISDTSNNFISKLRVSVLPPGANPPKMPDGFKPFDVAFLHDVVARTAMVEWLPLGYVNDCPDFEHAPSRWSYRAVSGEDELKAATYLTCPRQTRSGRAWVDAIHAAERQTDHIHGTTFIPARRISLQDDKLRSMLGEVHSLAEWVATYDELLDKRQLRANNVNVVRYRRQRTNGRNIIVSSTSDLRLLSVLVKRRLGELGLSLTEEQIDTVSKRLIDDALSISGDIVLRAAKRGVSAGELIGLVLSRWLMEQEFNIIGGGGAYPRLMVFFLLDDYAAWLAQQENRLADLLGVCVYENGDTIKLHISVVESKYVSANSAADAKRSSIAQLGATLSTLDEALFGDPGRLDRDLWLSRLSDLLLDSSVPPGLTGLLERARSAIRDGAVTISMRGYSEIYIHSVDTNGNSPGSERHRVEVKGSSPAAQEVFDRSELRCLLEAYATNGDSISVRKTIGDDEPWNLVNARLPASRTTWNEMVNQLLPVAKTLSNTMVVESGVEQALCSLVLGQLSEVPTNAVTQEIDTQLEIESTLVVTESVIGTAPPLPSVKVSPSTGMYGPMLGAIIAAKATGKADEENERAIWAEDVTSNLKSALNSYGLQAQVLGTRLTPNGCLVRLAGSDKLRVVDIESRQLQLLTTHGIRLVTVQPKPGEIVVTLEGDKRQAVSLWDVWTTRMINRNAAGINISFVLGVQELNGAVLYLNLGGDFGGLTQHEPHSLIAGATGSGKSVLIQALLLDIAATNYSSLAKIILIDPKMGVDYAMLDSLPHLREPVVTEKERATEVLAALVEEMESRYRAFAAARVRDLATYNAASAPSERLPMVFLIHDEFADWMLDDNYKSAVSAAVQRLGVKARAAGIHLFFAAQRPDKDVMPMQLRDNLGNRLILKVASEATSKIVLDRSGAELLLGRGHLAARLSGEHGLVYAQVPFLSDSDIIEAVEAIKNDDVG